MSNYILLCHGAPKDFSSLQLPANTSVQYRGNYGTPLSSDNAKALVQALTSNAQVGDGEIAKQIRGYTGQAPLEGGKSYAPDFNLQGDDHLLCFLMKMEGRRPWALLGSDFKSTLSRVVADLGSPLWLNLLCCSSLPGLDMAPAMVKDGLQLKSWDQVIRT
jgi:hypothetical protein